MTVIDGRWPQPALEEQPQGVVLCSARRQRHVCVNGTALPPRFIVALNRSSLLKKWCWAPNSRSVLLTHFVQSHSARFLRV